MNYGVIKAYVNKTFYMLLLYMDSDGNIGFK